MEGERHVKGISGLLHKFAMAAKGSMKEFAVRLATVDDADEVSQLMKLMSDTQHVSDYFGSDATQLAKDLCGSWMKCFIAELLSDHKAVGFCMTSLAYSTLKGPFVHLSSVFVDPHYRGRGLCTALVTAVFRYARDVVNNSLVESYQADCNTQAASLLERMGFYNLTLSELWLSYRLDSAGLHNVLRTELRLPSGIRLEGHDDVSESSSTAYIVQVGHPGKSTDILLLIKEQSKVHGVEGKVKLTEDGLAQDIENGLLKCIVVEETHSQRLVGILIAHCFLTVDDGMTVRIEDVFVLPEHRGKELTRAMVIALCHWAQRQRAVAIVLRVLSWNTNAQSFYKAIGFKDEGERRLVTDFRSDGEHFTQFLARHPPEDIEI